jgi:heme A synthase
MTAISKADAKSHLLKRIGIMMGLLSVQFILGMLLNTMGEPDSSTKHSVNDIWHVILVLHIIIGVGLFISAAYILFYSFKNYRELKIPSAIAFSGIALAIVFGSLTASHIHSELMSFLMAMAFLVAIGTYGSTLGKISRP